MRKNNKYEYVTVYVDQYVKVNVQDIIDEISDDTLLEELKFRGLSISEGFSMNGLPPSTVYDELKLNVLKEAYSKYSLEELEQKLK